MRRLILLLLCLLVAASCDLNTVGIELSPGWSSKSLAAWRNAKPQMLTTSKEGKWLYISYETTASITAPSLASININTGRQLILLRGLHNAHTLKQAPDKSLWIGEQFKKGIIWRISEPDKLPDDQRIDRAELSISHPAIVPMQAAGVFEHSGFDFSTNGRFAYLTSAGSQGHIYRYALISRQLQVLHKELGWLAIANPESAEAEAVHLDAQSFMPLQSVAALPDGRILIVEPDRHRILQLDDDGDKARLSTYLDDEKLTQATDLAWDAQRQWLWITDGDKPSRLWAYNGNRLIPIASHKKARFTGIALHQEKVFLNLRDNDPGPEIILQLTEKPFQ